jgi:hypothetical protein
VYPVAQYLPVHDTDLGRSRAAHPVAHRSQRQQAPRLRGILCLLGQKPQIARAEVFPQRYRCTHGPPRESISDCGASNHSQTAAAIPRQQRVILIEGWYKAAKSSMKSE